MRTTAWTHLPRARSVAGAAGLLLAAWLGPALAASAAAKEADSKIEESGHGVLFEDATSVWRLEFDHVNGMVGRLYFPEMTGQGGALLDFDGDGDLDVYFRQGGLLGAVDTLQDLVFEVPPGAAGLGDRLFRNDGAPPGEGGPGRRFLDISERAGFAGTGYGMGAAAGDFDGDGLPDLALTNYGPNQLWRNAGDGTFRDVTAQAGFHDKDWSTSAAFSDLDRDGDLDLFVVNYVDFDVDENPVCYAESSAVDYCGPSAFAGQRDRLWENRGDGTFADVSVRSGIAALAEPGLGVVTGDFNDDGLTDLYVANDGRENALWLARGDGGFSNDALLAGAAVNRRGLPEASMGVVLGDFDEDGDEDVFLTHLTLESNTLYRNLGEGLFEDRSAEAGLAGPSLRYTSFGVGAFDADNDGYLDLAVANGAVKQLGERVAGGDLYPLDQPNQFFRNLGPAGAGTFQDVSAAAGFNREAVSRGLATGDLDNDGATDLVIFNNNDRSQILRNLASEATPGAGWIGLTGDLRAPARARVATHTGRRQRASRPDGSYCSSSDPRILIGLGAGRPEWVELALGGPKPRTIRFLEPPANRYLVLPRAADAGR